VQITGGRINETEAKEIMRDAWDDTLGTDNQKCEVQEHAETVVMNS
jgi:hypothetical protein